MPNTVLFDAAGHKNILLEDFGHGLAVQANQHIIIDGKEGMILDPGGHKVYNKALSETSALLRGNNLKYLFLSHQDPDILAATNGWLMTTDAEAYISALWLRFVPHFGIDKYVEHRLKPIPDTGTFLQLGSTELMVIPAHWLHSPGNFQIYDPTSKILYSGDLGASLGMPDFEVKDFKTHLQYMDGFHRRYMCSNRALRNWVKMVRTLDIEIIAPQHGAFFRGKDLVRQFLDYMENLPCGIDLMENAYRLPSK